MVRKLKNKKVLLVGVGQHAKVVSSMIIDDNNLKLIGVIGTGIVNKYEKTARKLFFQNTMKIHCTK